MTSGQTLSAVGPSKRQMRVLLVTVILLALFVAALPRPTEAGPEPPTLLATAYNTQRKLARSEDGVLYAAVTNNVSGTPMVRVLSTTDGGNWSTLPPPSATNLASDRSSLAIDSLGRLHLVWTELTVDNGQVFHARFASGAWSPPVQLSHSPGYAGFPSLAVDAQDRAHVAWYGFDGTFYQIYYRRLDPGGWTNEDALTNEAVDATNPALALGPEGHAHIAWFRQNRQGTATEVAYLRLESDVIRETRTVSAGGMDALDPSLAVGTDGTVHLAWSALLGPARIQYVQRSPAGAWSPAEFVSPPSVGGLHPSLALHGGAGDVRIVWEGSDGEIYTQDRVVEYWSSPTRLSVGGVNRYPNARWSQDHNPVCPRVSVDVVWTREDGGTPRLEYAALGSTVPCRSVPIVRNDWPLIAAGFAVVVASGIAGFFIWRRRKWYPKPPT